MYIYVNLVKYLKWLPHFLTQFFCPWRTSVGGRISFCWYILFLTVNTFLLSTTFLSFDAFLLADAFLMKRRTAVSSNSCGMTVSALPLALLIFFFLLLTYCSSLKFRSVCLYFITVLYLQISKKECFTMLNNTQT